MTPGQPNNSQKDAVIAGHMNDWLDHRETGNTSQFKAYVDSRKTTAKGRTRTGEWMTVSERFSQEMAIAWDVEDGRVKSGLPPRYPFMMPDSWFTDHRDIFDEEPIEPRIVWMPEQGPTENAPAEGNDLGEEERSSESTEPENEDEDPRYGPALFVMHTKPKKWDTVERLGILCGTSWIDMGNPSIRPSK